MRLRLAPLFVFPLALTLVGCDPGTAASIGVATPIFVQKRHVNVMNASYAAVDTITQQTAQRMGRDRPIIVHQFEEIVPEPDQTGPIPAHKSVANPNLGQVLTAQMRTRFSQLGYNVVLDKTALAESQNNNPVDYYGTYELYGFNLFGSNGTLKVATRLVDRNSQRIIGVYDYSLPVTDEVRAYMADGNTIMPKPFRD